MWLGSQKVVCGTRTPHKQVIGDTVDAPARHMKILLKYVISTFAVCVRTIFALWEDRAGLQHGILLTLG